MIRSFLVAGVSALLIAGCGGGGGTQSTSAGSGGTSTGNTGTGGTTAVTNDPGLTLTPANLNINLIQTEVRSVSVDVHANRDFPEVVNILIADNGGLLVSKVNIEKQGTYNYRATFQVGAGVPPGVYTGFLEIRLCKDAPTVCARPHDGSPWKLPYRVEVKATNQSALKAMPGAADWTVSRGNSAQNAYVPVTLDASKITPRFVYVMNNYQLNVVSGIATQNGKLFFTIGNIFSPGTGLYAVDENNGTLKWVYGFTGDFLGNVFVPDSRRPRNPGLGNGKVYVVGTIQYGDLVTMYAIDQTSGKLNAVTQINESMYTINHAPAPVTMDDTGLYFPTVGGISKFDSTTLAKKWTYEAKPQLGLEYTVPLFDQASQYLYTSSITGGNNLTLDKIDKSSGTMVASVFLQPSTRALCPDGGLMVVKNAGASGSMLRLDGQTMKTLWSIDDQFNAPFACSDTAIVAVNGKNLDVRSVSTGSLLWSLPVPEIESFGLSGLILTRNMLIFSTSTSVVAVDLNSHQRVWSFEQGGALSLSKNGILYVSSITYQGLDNKIFAFNLQ